MKSNKSSGVVRTVSPIQLLQLNREALFYKLTKEALFIKIHQRLSTVLQVTHSPLTFFFSFPIMRNPYSITVTPKHSVVSRT